MTAIFVWWIGEGAVEHDLLEHVRVGLAAAFERPVYLWESPERPRHAYDEKRKQWRTAPILGWLLEQGPGSGKVLGITDQDLFIPILTYVFGEAQLGGSAAVVSTARLLDGVDRAGRSLLVERLSKEALHEVGHAFGLVHCGEERCVMSRSPAVREVDQKAAELCEECRSRLDELPGGA
jgi:archaemetzincin